MIATLRLEAIGDNHTAARRSFGRVLHSVGRIPFEQRAHALSPRRPWVARIAGPCPRFGLARTFLTGLKDYRDANSHGSRGVYLTFVLYPGAVHEVHELLTWHKERRYYCHVVDGKIVELTAEQVAAMVLVTAAKIQNVINEAARA